MQIKGNPTEEEAAAIAAVISTMAVSSPAPEASQDTVLRLWVEASRRSAQRAGLQRGSWRMSGRIARRSRV